MYIATVGLDNDKTGKRFNAGDSVKAKDFPKKVIDAWLKRGHVVKDKKNGSDD